MSGLKRGRTPTAPPKPKSRPKPEPNGINLEVPQADTRAPRYTPELATVLVKLLHAGLSLVEAVAYMVPELSESALHVTASRWANDELTLHATQIFNGGKLWEDLDKEVRLELSRDKHLATCARYLYTHDFSQTADAIESAKLQTAYLTIDKYLQGRSIANDDKFTKLMRQMFNEQLTATVEEVTTVEAERLSLEAVKDAEGPPAS